MSDEPIQPQTQPPVSAPVETTPTTPLPEPIDVPAEPSTPELVKIENGLEAPPEAPEAPGTNDTPAPAPVQDSPNPTPSPVAPTIIAPTLSPKSFLNRALETIQFRKRAKLEKIIKLAMEKRSITNDQVEKLLRVSDATATRYLAQLVKEGRLRRVGHQAQPRYEPATGSIPTV